MLDLFFYLKIVLDNHETSTEDFGQVKNEYSSEKNNGSYVFRSINTKFEDLSNELIYEIFDYLDYLFLYEIFFRLNSRFQSLFVQSSLPLKISFPLTSKSLFRSRCEDFIRSNISRIISLNICKYFLEFFTIDRFVALQSLIIDSIPSEKISSIIQQLTSLVRFSSLTIRSRDYFHDENSIYLSIFHLNKLQFCKLTYPSSGERIPLPIALHSSSTLKSLILHGHCRLDQLISILSYTPQLQHLSCQYLYGSGSSDMNFSLNLMSIYFILYRITFDELKGLLSKIGYSLKKLRIEKSNDENYFHAEQWEDLIGNSMRNLMIFQFDYSLLIPEHFDRRLIDRFSSKFWVERKWFFDHYYYKKDAADYLNLFCLQRSKHFVLHERIDDDQSKLSGINLAQQLTIEGHLGLQPYSMRFPRVIKLTLKNTKLEEDSSFLTHLNSLVPLSQITDLIITENQISIDQLRLFPNLQSLTLSNLPTRMKTYRNTKLVKLNIDDDVCELKHLRHLLRFFPHLQSLEIGMNEDQWKDILRLILTKSTNLFSLFLLNINSQFFEKISKFLQKENLIEDYTIERMEGGLYLWW